MKSVKWEIYFVFDPKNSEIKLFYAGVYDDLVSFLNLETRCSQNSATSLIQRWVQTCCSSIVISSEDQVC